MDAVLAAARLDEEGGYLLLAGEPVAPGEVLAAPFRFHGRHRRLPALSARRCSGNGCADAARYEELFDMTMAEADQAAPQWVTDTIGGWAAIFKSSEASAERRCRRTAPTADRRSRG